MHGEEGRVLYTVVYMWCAQILLRLNNLNGLVKPFNNNINNNNRMKRKKTYTQPQPRHITRSIVILQIPIYSGIAPGVPGINIQVKAFTTTTPSARVHFTMGKHRLVVAGSHTLPNY